MEAQVSKIFLSEKNQQNKNAPGWCATPLTWAGQ